MDGGVRDNIYEKGRFCRGPTLLLEMVTLNFMALGLGRTLSGKKAEQYNKTNNVLLKKE